MQGGNIMQNIIEFTNLTKSFKGKKALDNCSLTIEKGEIFGYLGPSGAGKTTTMKLLTGQLQRDSGDILIFGKHPFSPDIKKQIGIMSDMSGIYEKMSVYENLELFADIYGVNHTRIQEVLKQVDLYEDAKKLAGKLSKGMKQRLIFARTIIHNPSLLFLDEPTANLDPATAQEVRNLIKKLNQHGTTVFLTTHNMDEADELCDRIAFLDNGHIIECGKPKELKLKYSYHMIDITTPEEMITIPMQASSLIEAIQQHPDFTMIHSQEPTLKDVFLSLTGGKTK